MKLYSFSSLIAAISLAGPFLSSTLLATPVITEFVASNDGSLLDEDSLASDWIEIKNSGATAINLAGWKLTDDSANPAKWTFPSVLLQPNEHLLVFASGKNQSIAGAELHTNFSLSAAGEYLALISPVNVVATEFAPSYPPQETGSSYGSSTPSNEIVLITENDACKAKVPDAAYHAAIGDTWKDNDPGFDDSTWISGSQGVGYDERGEFDSDIGLDVGSMMNNINPSVYIRIPITSEIDPANILSLTLRVKFEDGFASFVNGTTPANASSFAPAVPTWNSTTEGGNHPETQAGVFQDFDLSDTIPTLEAGTNNILAIQGLNASTGSSDYLFRAELVAQVADVGAASIGFFTTPTPGTINGSVAYDGFLTDTGFDFGRGLYSAAFTETISCPDLGATIIYTTDGSVPSTTNGTQVPAADESSAPIVSIPISTTTVLRAMAVRSGYRSTNVDTQTYLFINDVLTQDGAGLPHYTSGSSIWDYVMDPDIVDDPRFSTIADDLQSLPILSVVMPVEDVWGSNGVYRNPTSEGSAWERACSVEILNPDGTPGYQVDGGLRIQGSGSRRRAIGKKSMRLAFRKDYGSSRFKYPLWGPTGPSEVSNIVLRGSYFDSWTFQSDSGSADGITRSNALQFRTHFATVAHGLTGNQTIATNWVHLYINGQYWGPYNTHERPDGEFAEYHNGGDETDYTVIKTNGELIQGRKTEWNALMSLCGENDPANIPAIMAQIDQDRFIDYIFMNIWGGNNDWPHNNWYVHRNNTTEGPFRFYVWDPEHYIFATSSDRTGVSNSNSPGIIYDRLRRDLEFKVRFGDHVHRHMFNDGVYTLQNIQTLWQNMADELLPAMNGESARWGDEHTSSPYNTADHWLPHVAYRKNTYMPTRHNLVLSQLRGKSLYPDTAAPVFSQHGGTIVAGQSLSMTNPDSVGTLYYTTDGSDPRLAGGAVAGTALVYNSAITLPGSITLKARVKNTDGEWSALNEASFTTGSLPSLSNIAISEIHYNPQDVSVDESNAGFTDKDDFEFIELMNTGTTVLDLTTLEFIEGISFDFTTLADPLLAVGGRLLLAKNSTAFSHRYGSASDIAGNYTGRLSNSGETITLIQGGSVLLSFAYNDKHPWPESADGQGASLVLINPMSNPLHSLAGNWRASGQVHGSPASEELLPTLPAAPMGDSNANGRADLVDYAVIGRPRPGHHSIGLDDFLTIGFTLDGLAEGAVVSVQYSEDLSSWVSEPTDVDMVEETHNGDGTISYVWRALKARGNDSMQYLRVKVEER